MGRFTALLTNKFLSEFVISMGSICQRSMYSLYNSKSLYFKKRVIVRRVLSGWPRVQDLTQRVMTCANFFIPHDEKIVGTADSERIGKYFN